MITIAVEGAAYHAADLRERPEMFSDELRAGFELGSFYQATDYVQAQRLRRHLMRPGRRDMAGLDAIVMPTSPVPATPIEGAPPGHAMLRPRNTMPFNALGLPAISVPCGFTAAGLPIGLQIAGHAFDEAGVLRDRARLRAGHRLAPQAAALARDQPRCARSEGPRARPPALPPCIGGATAVAARGVAPPAARSRQINS